MSDKHPNEIIDSEFGTIIIRRSRASTHVRVRLGVDGRLVVSCPPRTSLKLISSFINSSRDKISKFYQENRKKIGSYQDNQLIGKNQTLRVVPTSLEPNYRLAQKDGFLLVYLNPSVALESSEVQADIAQEVVRLLRKQAKRFLPSRVEHWAQAMDAKYTRLRFSHSIGRWGSCSSTGTISLNIALMKLPDRLIDYVLIHELSHTRHLNHSKEFWALVAAYDPSYLAHRQLLKQQTPTV